MSDFVSFQDLVDGTATK